MSAPEVQIIQSFFAKTLVEYIDATEALTALYDDGKTPDETLLHEHVMLVSRKRDKLVTTIQSARYHHGSDLGLIIPNLHIAGGIC